MVYATFIWVKCVLLHSEGGEDNLNLEGMKGLIWLRNVTGGGLL